MQVVGHDDKSQGFCVLQISRLPQAVDQATGRVKVGEEGLTVQGDGGQQIDLPGLRVPPHTQTVRVGCVRHLRASLRKIIAARAPLPQEGRRFYL
jgi:hypothetical protein